MAVGGIFQLFASNGLQDGTSWDTEPYAGLKYGLENMDAIKTVYLGNSRVRKILDKKTCDDVTFMLLEYVMPDIDIFIPVDKEEYKNSPEKYPYPDFIADRILDIDYCGLLVNIFYMDKKDFDPREIPELISVSECTHINCYYKSDVHYYDEGTYPVSNSTNGRILEVIRKRSADLLRLMRKKRSFLCKKRL